MSDDWPLNKQGQRASDEMSGDEVSAYIQKSYNKRRTEVVESLRAEDRTFSLIHSKAGIDVTLSVITALALLVSLSAVIANLLNLIR